MITKTKYQNPKFKQIHNILDLNTDEKYNEKTITCFSRSATCLLSKSIPVFAFGSGFSLIFSIMNESTVKIASTFPVIKHTLSVVPVKNFFMKFLKTLT